MKGMSCRFRGKKIASSASLLFSNSDFTIFLFVDFAFPPQNRCWVNCIVVTPDSALLGDFKIETFTTGKPIE